MQRPSQARGWGADSSCAAQCAIKFPPLGLLESARRPRRDPKQNVRAAHVIAPVKALFRRRDAAAPIAGRDHVGEEHQDHVLDRPPLARGARGDGGLEVGGQHEVVDVGGRGRAAGMWGPPLAGACRLPRPSPARKAATAGGPPGPQRVLLGRRGLARTSGTPGRTRQMNFFLVNERFVLADLPGYGFAVGSEAERRSWAAGRGIPARAVAVRAASSSVVPEGRRAGRRAGQTAGKGEGQFGPLNPPKNGMSRGDLRRHCLSFSGRWLRRRSPRVDHATHRARCASTHQASIRGRGAPHVALRGARPQTAIRAPGSGFKPGSRARP